MADTGYMTSLADSSSPLFQEEPTPNGLVMASPFGVGSYWRRCMEESTRLVVHLVSVAIWVEGILGLILGEGK